MAVVAVTAGGPLVHPRGAVALVVATVAAALVEVVVAAVTGGAGIAARTHDSRPEAVVAVTGRRVMRVTEMGTRRKDDDGDDALTTPTATSWHPGRRKVRRSRSLIYRVMYPSSSLGPMQL